jgi:uncharacterized membrane protein
MEIQHAQGADEALEKLEKLNRDFRINLHDAAVVQRPFPDTLIGTNDAGEAGG